MASTKSSATGADRTVRVVEDAAAAVVSGAVVATEEMAVAAAEDAEEIAEEPLSEALVAATSRRASASQFVGRFVSHASLHTPWRRFVHYDMMALPDFSSRRGRA